MPARVPAQTNAPAAAHSWILPEAKREALVYESDSYNNVVDIYKYGTNKQVGVLVGFDAPSGLCVDAQGDVWVTTSSGYSASEYPHGGTASIRTVRTDGEAVGCAVNPVNGDLAIGNSDTPMGPGNGDLQIFKTVGRKPKDYYQINCAWVEAPGYDPNGNLYVEADSNAGWGVCELPVNGKELVQLKVDRKIPRQGNVMWDGKYIAFSARGLGSRGNIVIYQAIASASALKVVGKTLLTDPCGYFTDVFPFFVVGKRNIPGKGHQDSAVAGSNYACPREYDYWSYPAGGNPSRVVTGGPYGAEGTAVSFPTEQPRRRQPF